MQGKRLLLTLSGLIALFVTMPAFAAMSAPDGWYVEGNIGSTKITDKDYPGNESTASLGGSGAVGYKFMPYLGAEVGYTQYGNTTIKDPSTGGTKAGTDRHYSYNVAAKGILPIAESGFEAFTKVGVGEVVSNMSINNAEAAANLGLDSERHDDTSYYLSIGGQYYFTPELAVVVQWAQAHGDSSTGTMALTSVGLSFIFN